MARAALFQERGLLGASRLTVWTVMMLLYTHHGEEIESKILFPSFSKCSEAIDVMKAPLDKWYDDVAVICYRTTEISGTVIRPRARP